jgi:hypothetical protein
VPFSARSECTQRPGPPEGYPAFADPRPVRGGAMQEFSEVRGITSRKQLAPDPYNKRSIRGVAEG